MRHFAALSLIALAACTSTENNTTVALNGNDVTANTVAPTPAPLANATDDTTDTAVSTADADYLGKWVGPEGLVLDVTARPGGGVAIANQWTLDDKGSFEGSVTAEGLRFMRKGEAVAAARTDGDATGMKWLAGKKDCLTVRAGSEAYCRN